MKKKNIPASVASTNTYEGLEDWARSRVQVWLQELLEDEVTQFLGREKSERSADRRGYRNGHGKPRRFAMMNGTMEVRRTRVRNTAERFESQILPYFQRKSKQLASYFQGTVKLTNFLEGPLIEIPAKSLIVCAG